MISQVRQYFTNRILEVDSDFKQHLDFFNKDNIANSNFDKAYHLEYSSLLSDFINHQNATDDNLSVNLRLFFKGYNETIERFDLFTDLANQIRINIVGAYKATFESNMLAVSMSSMNWEYPNGNDNSLIVNMSFNIKMAFQIN